ncbi:MAG: hypothetical protein EOO41_05285, partial [Methanobacteriota archaeon]
MPNVCIPEHAARHAAAWEAAVARGGGSGSGSGGLTSTTALSAALIHAHTRTAAVPPLPSLDTAITTVCTAATELLQACTASTSSTTLDNSPAKSAEDAYRTLVIALAGAILSGGCHRLRLQHGSQHTFTRYVAVSDLHAWIPSASLEFCGGLLQTPSYMLQRNNAAQLMRRGIFVSQPGYSFARAGVPAGAVLTSIGGVRLDGRLSQAARTLAAIAESEKVPIKFITLDEPHFERVAILSMDWAWGELTWWSRAHMERCIVACLPHKQGYRAALEALAASTAASAQGTRRSERAAGGVMSALPLASSATDADAVDASVTQLVVPPDALRLPLASRNTASVIHGRPGVWECIRVGPPHRASTD